MDQNNIIIIEGGSYDIIRKVLKQWIDLFSDDKIENDLVFMIYKNGRANHLIVADKKLDNGQFGFLINYLRFPENVDYKIKIEGFTTVTDQTLLPNEYINKKILLFIPNNFNEGEYVFAVTEDNEVMEINFSGRFEKASFEKQYIEPKIDFSGLPHPDTFTIEKTAEPSDMAVPSDSIKLKKRFTTLCLIMLGLFLSNYLTYNNPQLFSLIMGIIGVSICNWFIWDYKLWQMDKYYYRTLFFSLIVFFYGYFQHRQLSPRSGAEFITFGTTLPLICIILQRLWRFAFKALMKREPIAEYPYPSVEDKIYILILYFTSLISTALVAYGDRIFQS